MAPSLGYWYWKLGLASWLAMSLALALGGGLSPIASSGDCALAQIKPDGTLGAESSVVTPTNVNGLPTNQIDGGAKRGANLFHSFDSFSVPTGGAAYFNNALDIQNIISRVTGESLSNIDGLLRANGTANLFLLNPNGIIFGPNAQLNIGGSFVASTASSMNFADGNQFSATAPTTTPLLRVSVPIGLQYGGTTPGGIQVQGSDLQVQTGQTLALMGGSVSVEEFGFLQALGGRIELGGLAGAGMVEIEGQQSEEAFRLTKLRFPDAVSRADVLLTNYAYVDVAGGGGGSIAINARNIDIAGGSVLRGGLGKGFPLATAGDITLNATGAINIANGFIRNHVGTGAVGNGGSINITTGSLSVTDGAQLGAVTFGQGNAGSVIINARDNVSFDNSNALSRVEEDAVGRGGNIEVTTGSLSLTNGGQLDTSPFGQGDAGNIIINARDTVSLDGASPDYGELDSTIFTEVVEDAVGNGGNVEIITGSLFVTNGAALISRTSGRGNAGSIIVRARDLVLFDGAAADGSPSSLAFSDVEENAIGRAGNIEITTGSLSITNGAQLSASTSGRSNAGSVIINARERVLFEGTTTNGEYGSAAFSRVDEGAMGDGGNIEITTGSLSVVNGAQLQAATLGKGNAGSVIINAGDRVSFEGRSANGRLGSAAASSVEENALGRGGNIVVTTDSLSVTDGARLIAHTKGQGDAGNVIINARDTVSFDGVSSDGFVSAALSTVESGAVGNGGGINITTGSLSVTNGAFLSASSEGSGAAGNLEVATSSIRLENQAFLSSDTTGGQGNIILRSEDLVLRRGSNITTDATGTATGGNITIDTGVIAALENSDISANASEAFGGRVIIDAQGIFGTEFRDRLTPESDITASSRLGPQFSGTVEINTPDVDPSQGIAALPAQLVDASGLIASGCGAGGRQGSSKFIVTGRGGLPIRPHDANISPYPTGTVRSIPSSDPSSETSLFSVEGSDRSTNPTPAAPTQIVEARGWVINNKGEVVLTATAPNITPHIPWLPSATCARVLLNPMRGRFG